MTSFFVNYVIDHKLKCELIGRGRVKQDDEGFERLVQTVVNKVVKG